MAGVMTDSVWHWDAFLESSFVMLCPVNKSQTQNLKTLQICVDLLLKKKKFFHPDQYYFHTSLRSVDKSFEFIILKFDYQDKMRLLLSPIYETLIC